MKQLFTFIVIFGLGAITYALLNTFVFEPKVAPEETPEVSLPEFEASPAETDIEDLDEPMVAEDTTTIAPDGSLLDGPFIIFDAEGKRTEATVEIVRSPEERLLQFEDLSFPLSDASRIYFATDRTASTFFDLAPAAMETGVYIYGIPLDADLGAYDYILIYDTQLAETLYYAKIQ